MDNTSIQQYLQSLHRAVRPGGYALLATFHLNGPKKCSGLPVQRYDADALISTLNDYNHCRRDLFKAREWTHLTSAGTKQQFQYLHVKRASLDAEVSLFKTHEPSRPQTLQTRRYLRQQPQKFDSGLSKHHRPSTLDKPIQ